MHFYLLSVLSIIAAGATAAADYLVERLPVLEPLRRFAANSRAKATLGGITLGIGFVKLFWRAPAEAIIVGDLLPALAGILLGAMLMLDRYRERRIPGSGAEQAEQVTTDDEAGEGDALPASSDAGATGIGKLHDALRPYRTPLGLAGMAVGVVHFLLASVLFL